jgi:gliding motility-associated protein GldM
MAGGNISPRQKMINMMYLVLTALLAMNVSKEILNAFVSVNNSIQKSNSIMASKNEATYKAFADAEKDPQTAAKAKIWKEKADKIKAISAELVTFVETQKQELKKGSDLKIENGEEVFSVDNLDVATHLLIEKKGGDVIYDKMLETKKKLLATIDPKDFADNPAMQATIKRDMEAFAKSLPIDMTVAESKESGHKAEQSGKGWSEANFHMTPTIAALTILSKLQSDVKSSESQLIDYCYSQIGQVKIVYDEFQAIASANTNYCMPGDPIEIIAGVGAFSEAAKPTVTIGGANIALVDGQAIYKTQASGSGDRVVPVKISFTKPDGTIATVEKQIKYTIGTPSGAAVMFDKMNVLYIGVPNPLTISSGTGAEKTNASLSTGGSLSKGSGPGKYIANVTTPTNDAKIIVSADGKSTQYPVRIKRIPDPVPTLGGKIKGGKINKATLAAQGGIVALLENFDFDARFNILSYTFILVQKGGDVSPKKVDGPVINEGVKSSISRAKPGDIILFDDIKAKGPDGTVRNLPPLNLTII